MLFWCYGDLATVRLMFPRLRFERISTHTFFYLEASEDVGRRRFECCGFRDIKKWRGHVGKFENVGRLEEPRRERVL
jgi:hypothetical protein